MTTRPCMLALACLALLAVTPTAADACSFDNEDNGFSLDTLDHYHPGSYDVVLKVVEARRFLKLHGTDAQNDSLRRAYARVGANADTTTAVR